MKTFTHHHVQYAGFWRRLLAFSVDTMVLSLLSSVLALLLFGREYFQAYQTAAISLDWRSLLLEQGLPAIWAVGFWMLWMATPGKLLVDCQIIDERTAGKPSLAQYVLRYLGYILSALPLGLGFLWILFDKRKQGWHDKLSHTLVVMQDESRNPLESYA